MKNKKIVTTEGETFWVTDRLSGCSVYLFKYINYCWNICLVKRTSKVSDKPDRWCCPCGYLDGDESGIEGAIRELNEETGIKLEKDDLIQSWVSSEVWENHQHISHQFVGIYNDEDSFKPLDKKEISEVKWVPVDEISKYNLIFGHETNIKLHYEKLYALRSYITILKVIKIYLKEGKYLYPDLKLRCTYKGDGMIIIEILNRDILDTADGQRAKANICTVLSEISFTSKFNAKIIVI